MEHAIKCPTTVQALAKHTLMLKGKGPALFVKTPAALHTFAERMRQAEPGLFYLMASGTHAQLQSNMIETHAHVRWCTFGLPAFEVSADMLAGLVLTDPRKVHVADVHFPFPTFAISLPRGFWSIRSKDGSRDVEGVTVIVHTYEAITPDSEARQSIMIQMICTDGTSLWDRVTWPREETFAGWLDNSAVEYVIEGTLTDGEKKLQLALRRVVVNLALWVAQFGRGRKKTTAQPRKKKKRKPKRAAMFNAPSCEVWALGHAVKLQPELIAAARADVGATGEQWRLSKRICVRGHHKRQAYGKGRKLRRWIWIEPYWKGPTDAERLAHIYIGADDGK
jgi:hypothetical protein